MFAPPVPFWDKGRGGIGGGGTGWRGPQAASDGFGGSVSTVKAPRERRTPGRAALYRGELGRPARIRSHGIGSPLREVKWGALLDVGWSRSGAERCR